MALKHWTDEELELLTANYERMGNEELSKLFSGRTPMSIKHKLGRLGLSRGSWALPPDGSILLPDLTETQKSYFAGHFDGEGCIRLASNGRSYKIQISVTAAHKPVLDSYLACFSGSIHAHGGVNKPLFCWSLTGYYRSLRFIETIFPYAMEKREQLEVARDYIVKRIDASVTQPSDDIRELARVSAHRLTALKKF